MMVWGVTNPAVVYGKRLVLPNMIALHSFSFPVLPAGAFRQTFPWRLTLFGQFMCREASETVFLVLAILISDRKGRNGRCIRSLVDTMTRRRTPICACQSVPAQQDDYRVTTTVRSCDD